MRLVPSRCSVSPTAATPVSSLAEPVKRIGARLWRLVSSRSVLLLRGEMIRAVGAMPSATAAWTGALGAPARPWASVTVTVAE